MLLISNIVLESRWGEKLFLSVQKANHLSAVQLLQIVRGSRNGDLHIVESFRS